MWTDEELEILWAAIESRAIQTGIDLWEMLET